MDDENYSEGEESDMEDDYNSEEEKVDSNQVNKDYDLITKSLISDKRYM